MIKVNASARLEADKWSQDVTENMKHHTPEGLFTKSADAIAQELKKEHGDNFQSAMSALSFYYNRKGELSSEERSKWEAARTKLRKLYGKDE